MKQKKEPQKAALFTRFIDAALRRADIEEQVPVVEKEDTASFTKYEDTPRMPKHKNKLGKMVLRQVKPQTFTQQEVFKAFMSGGNLMLHGIAGTGKTYIALYLALKERERYQQEYDKVIVIRSAVPSRDVGYVPGDLKEKAAIYETPYELVLNKLYERGDAYSIAKSSGLFEFTTTSFLRGMTFDRAIVVVDEIQNMSYGELQTIITRMGDNTRVIFCGDFRQTDLFRVKEREGLHHFMSIVENMKEFTCHEFNVTDICRGKLVKSFIVEEAEYRKKHPAFDL